MQGYPFLPGLLLALAAWILPLAAHWIPGWILSRIAARAPWLAPWEPWIRSIGFPYLGLILGWVSSRDYGLTGHTQAEWLLGTAAAVALGIVLGRMSVRFSIGFGGYAAVLAQILLIAAVTAFTSRYTVNRTLEAID